MSQRGGDVRCEWAMGPCESWPEDEFALVERAKVDPEAFGELYSRYFARIYAFAYSRLSTRAEAEDATSDLFFNALRGIRGYRRTDKPFKAWLYRIAANVITDRARRRRPCVTLEAAIGVAADLPDAAETVVDQARIRGAWDAVNRLPRHQRIAITLRYAADLSEKSIAEVMGRSTPAVKLLIFRGTRTLRGKLVPNDEGLAAQGGISPRYV